MKTLRDFTVGERFELVRTVDPYRPIYYAAASGDFNPIHIDPVVAHEAGYHGVILQGMCTFAWLADACAAPYERALTRLAQAELRLAAGASIEIFGLQAEAQPGPSDYKATNNRGGVYAKARFATDELTVTSQSTDVHDSVIRIVSMEN